MVKGEKQAALAKDPVPSFRAWLIANVQATEAELAKLEAQIKQEIDAAVDYALSSPEPDLAELRKDVFAAEIAG